MAGRRNRRRRAKVEVAPPADDSPAKASSSSSSSGGSTDRTSPRKIPLSRLQSQPEKAEDEAWTQSETRAIRRRLLDIIHRYYLDAISRLPPAELRTTPLPRGLLVAGHCFGPLHPVHNIILNSLWYAAAFPLRTTGHDDLLLLSADGLARICHRSLNGLLASLRHYCPSLSAGDALWQLFSAGADLASAIALSNGISKSGAQHVMATQGPAAFHLAAETARHPNPAAFAQFASSVLPAVNVQHNFGQFLLMNHVLSTMDTSHLSNLLVSALPCEPPQSPLVLSPQALDLIASHKKQFKDTGNQVLDIVNMALQEYTIRSGEQLMLHSVCGASLLKEEDANNCYHINFLANHKSSGSALGTPLLFFTEAVILACDETDIRLCVPVDPVTDIGCCFACVRNKKKLVHPFYDEFLGVCEFAVDEVDYGGDFPNPLDVDYILFDADRDRSFANYLHGSTDN